MNSSVPSLAANLAILPPPISPPCLAIFKRTETLV